MGIRTLDCEYKYDMRIRYLNSNPDFGKCQTSIQILGDWHENLISS